MPPSQLKRLKAALHETGVTGPQKSKKQRKNSRQSVEQKTKRDAALQNIRENFQPFEVKAPNRISKRDVTTVSKGDGKGKLVRPGVSKGQGEELRRRTLQREVERRHKVGGVVDRRIGEEGRVERAQKQKAKRSVFDLGDEDEDILTHLGKRIDGEENGEERDDFDAGSLKSESGDESPKKRRREDNDGAEVDADEEEPIRKKTKKEVMEEVIAKSKLHKYERQQARENDDALREELDKGLGDIQAALSALKPSQPRQEEALAPSSKDDIYMNPERAVLLNGTSSGGPDKDYELKLHQLAQEGRSRPAERTKTEEEKAKEDAEREQQQEEQRLRRMRGGDNDEDEQEDKVGYQLNDFNPFLQAAVEDDAAEFGFKAPNVLERPPGFEEDEDEFVIDDDLVTNESETEDLSEAASDDDIPDEILALANGTNGHQEESSVTVQEGDGGDEELRPTSPESKATYQIPLSPSGIQVLMAKKRVEQAPEIIRRIRAQYDLSLSTANKPMLANFAQALVSYIRILARNDPPAPLAVTEKVIRHVHSMSRTFPTEIAETFRNQIDRMHKNDIVDAGDLALLTAIGTIYPTSDHFHQVVTPAITLIAKWLGTTRPKTPREFHIGAYLVALVLKYQALSKRYIPEANRFTFLALRSQSSKAVLQPHVANLRAMAELWHDKSAFIEIFTPDAVTQLRKLKLTKELRHMTVLLSQARLRRRALQLHQHRPLPIKTAIPKFEEGFNPERFYDPDAERSEAARLRKEYKKERKGAMRELRKDSNFMAREQLKEKKERDRAYEEKMKKLVASVQTEEGMEANEYRRERRARKAGR